MARTHQRGTAPFKRVQSMWLITCGPHAPLLLSLLRLRRKFEEKIPPQKTTCFLLEKLHYEAIQINIAVARVWQQGRVQHTAVWWLYVIRPEGLLSSLPPSAANTRTHMHTIIFVVHHFQSTLYVQTSRYDANILQLAVGVVVWPGLHTCRYEPCFL